MGSEPFEVQRPLGLEKYLYDRIVVDFFDMDGSNF